MFCQNCGEKLVVGAKFCASCGGAVSGADSADKKDAVKKPKRKLHWWRGTIVALVLLLAMVMGVINEIYSANSDTAIGALTVTIMFVAFYIVAALFIIFIGSLARLRREPKKSLMNFLGIAAVLVAVFLMIHAVNDNYYKKAVADLPFLQNNLVEIEAQRILGDSLDTKNDPGGKLMAKVRDAVNAAGKKMNGLSVSSPLIDYQKTAVLYADQVFAAASGIASWESLPDAPGDFRLDISQRQAGEMMRASMETIAMLKEFGDNAIQRKDRDAMRYIAARLLVQQHWLNGIRHFSDAGIWADSGVAPVYAQDLYVPPVGPGCEVDLSTGGCKTSRPPIIPYNGNTANQQQAPITPTVPKVTTPPAPATLDQKKLLLEQETILDCERWGGTCTPDQIQKAQQAQVKLDEVNRAIQQAQEQARQKQNTAPQVPAATKPVQQQTPKTPAPLAVPKTPDVPQTEPAVSEADTALAYHYDESERPSICIVGPHANGTYCAEEAVQSTVEIAAAAIGFAGGKALSQDDWDKQFGAIENALFFDGTVGIGSSVPSIDGGHAEGGLGVVVEDSPAEGAQLPKFAQAFAAECRDKGGYVGGANQDKGRLATTEGGYHCNYKQFVNNCWDFLTYSGGRYMGGDVGCKELNLLPIALVVASAPAAKTETQKPAVVKISVPAGTAPTQKTAAKVATTNPPKTTDISDLPKTNPWDGSYQATQVTGGCSGSCTSDFLMPPASTLLNHSTDWQVFVNNNELIAFPMSAGVAIDVSGNASATIVSGSGGVTGAFHFYRSGSERLFNADINIAVSEPDPGSGGFSSVPCTVKVVAKALPDAF